MKLLVALLLFTVTCVHAQSNFNIVGNWKVTEVTLPPGLGFESLDEEDAYTATLMQTKFEFKSDNHFSFIKPDASSLVNVRWTYDRKSKQYLIDEWETAEPKGELMTMRVTQRSGKTNFEFTIGSDLYVFTVVLR